jgi:hypothetical protein
VAIDAPLGPTTAYGRMFPELPSFQADEQFLHALGRARGLCDCGDIDDTPDSLGDTAGGWPILGQFVLTTLRLTGPFCKAIPIPRGCTMRAAQMGPSRLDLPLAGRSGRLGAFAATGITPTAPERTLPAWQYAATFVERRCW